MSRLKDFINIDKRFQNSINLQLDIQNKNKVDGYIPTRSSINIRRIFRKRFRKQRQRKCFNWTLWKRKISFAFSFACYFVRQNR